MRVVFGVNDPIDRRMFDIDNKILFKPTVDHINIVDRLVEIFLSDKKQLKRLYWDTISGIGWDVAPPILEYKEYYKQYLGVIENNKEIIIINGLGFKKDYFSRIMAFPLGGGGFYFRIKVSLKPPMVVDMDTNDPM